MKDRGRSRGRKKFFFLLLGVLILEGGAGCRKSVLLPPDLSRSVRVEALLPLHPLWKQVEALDRTAAVPRRTPVTLAPLAIPSLPPLEFHETPAENLSLERQRRIQDDAQKYLAQLETYLRNNSKQRLAGEVRNFRRVREGQFAQKVVQRAEESQKAALNRKIEIEARMRVLQYTGVAYESQIRRIAIGPTREQIETRLRETRREIESLTSERDALPTDFTLLAQLELQPERNQIRVEVETFRKRRAEELEAEVKQRLTTRSKLLLEQPESISALSEIPPAPSLPLSQKTVAPLPATLPPAAPSVSPLPGRAGNLLPQKAALMEVIRRDMERAVLQEAKRQGWKLVSPEIKGSIDVTEEMRPLIQKQWTR